MRYTSRRLHRAASLFLLAPLVLAAVTAIAFRVGRSWLGMSPQTADWLMSLHEGRFLGETGRIVYLFLIGGALLYMCATGLGIVLGQRGRQLRIQGRRRLHRTLALWSIAPFVLIAITGVAYRLMPMAFGWSDAQSAFLLRLHEGTYFGQVGRTVWTVLTGGVLLALAWTGLRLALGPRPPAAAAHDPARPAPGGSTRGRA